MVGRDWPRTLLTMTEETVFSTSYGMRNRFGGEYAIAPEGIMTGLAFGINDHTLNITRCAHQFAVTAEASGIFLVRQIIDVRLPVNSHMRKNGQSCDFLQLRHQRRQLSLFGDRNLRVVNVVELKYRLNSGQSLLKRWAGWVEQFQRFSLGKWQGLVYPPLH